jgi:hypothetical protein
MQNTKFRMPKSTSVPTFSEFPSQIPRSTSTHIPTSTTEQKQRQIQPIQQPYFQKKNYTNNNNQSQQHQAYTTTHQYKKYPQYQYQPSIQRFPQYTPNQNIPIDYHLRLSSVIDNPKKIPNFDYIRVIPFGTPYAVYLQNNQLSFFPVTSDIPFSHIPHKTQVNKTLFMATMVQSGFFVITDILIYGGKFLSTNEERLTSLLDIFSKGVFTEVSTDITLTPTHLFSQWTDFSRGSIHIPYEIKHLEYCFYKEDIARQTQRYIYILNKKNLKKSSHVAELVITNSRDFRVDVDVDIGIDRDFKTCILDGIPYYNTIGYSHLDKQEESDEEM